MMKDIGGQFVQNAIRILVPAISLLVLAAAPQARAQDALSERYAAIRAPTEALVGRIARQRLQADIAALTRERRRVQGQRRQTEYLRFLDPASALVAAERALAGRLDRIDTDLRQTQALLADQSAQRGQGPAIGSPSLPVLDPGAVRSGLEPAEFDSRPMAESVEAARAFVEELLRAGRARR